MKIKIISKESNPLLKRTETAFEVEHGEKEGTPPRLEVRKELASALKVDLQLVYIKKIETKSGATTAKGEANVYDSLEQAKLVEPEYIFVRNVPPEKPEKEE